MRVFHSVHRSPGACASALHAPRKLLFIGICLAVPVVANANCVLQTGGSTVICDSSSPNPFTRSINVVSSGAGTILIPVNGASVQLNAGAALSTTGAAIQVENNSTVLNAGAISTTFINAYGMWAGDPGNSTSTTVGYGNTLENDGSIVTTGSNSVGLFARTYNRTAGNTLINRGTIDTYGAISGNSGRASSAGIRSESVMPSSVLNEGRVAAHGSYATITASGAVAISGNGVEMAGPGTFTNAAGASVSSDNAYGFYANGANANGITVINAGAIAGKLGAIQFGNGSSNNTVVLQAGASVTGAIDGGQGSSNGTLVFDGFQSGGFGNAVSNWQNLALRNAAAVTLTAPSYAFTQVSIDAGSSATLAGQQASIGGTIANDGALTFAMGSPNTITAAIQGSGSLIQNGAGMLTLAGQGSYSGPTHVMAGTLQAGAVGVLSSASAFTVESGATLDLGNAGQTIGSLAGAGDVHVGSGALTTGGLGSSTTFSGVIDGSGSVTKTGAGTFTLSGNNSYAGGTTIAGGVLQIGDGGSSGAIAGNVVDDGELRFQRGDAITFAGAIVGQGLVRQAGGGTTVLAGGNSYAGGTFIDRGVLAVAADTSLGDASSAVHLNGGTLRLDGDFDSGRALSLDGAGTIDTAGRNKFSGPVNGAGMLTKAGAGVLVFNTQAGSAVGSVHVSAGTLAIGDGEHADAQLGSTGGFAVDAGASFGGYGTADGDVDNAGTLGVGNALAAFAQQPDASFTINGQLRNSGVVTMANGTAGDRLLVNGNYVSSGGRLDLDAVLDEGGAAAQSDRLVVQSVSLAGQPTGIVVHQVGGAGAETVGDGIPLVQVANGGSSAAGAFVLAGRVVAGPYEYLLQQGGIGNPADGQWYLRSQMPVVQALPPGSPPTAVPEVVAEPIYRPEVGAYLTNRDIVSAMLLQTLHDRQVYPPYAGDASPEGAPGKVWLRVLDGTSRIDGAGGMIQTRGDQALVQLGGELASWNLFSSTDQVHLGAMFAHGNANEDAVARFNPATAHGHANGNFGGVYATWFADQTRYLGSYVDVWAQYGRFDNQLQSAGLPAVDYRSRTWAASLEYGYGIALGEHWSLEPEAQVIRSDYRSDDVTDSSGMRVRSLDGGDTLERVGLRLAPTFASNAALRPFLEVDWWHGGGRNAMEFGGTPIADAVPDHRYQVNAGFQGTLAKGLVIWARIGNAWGKDAYRRAEGVFGLKYSWM